MNSHLARLLVGLSVQISRSNGRIHRASVKAVDTIKSSVIVEWQEREQCLSKEVDLNELCTLNPDLQDYITSTAAKHDAPQSPAPDKVNIMDHILLVLDKGLVQLWINYNCFYVIARKSRRPTDLYQVPAVALSLPAESALPDIPAAVLTTSGQFSPFYARLIRGNSRRKTMAPPDLNKGNKRLSCLAKPPDAQGKRGKFVEGNRPNQKFYQMIQDFKETLEITPMSEADVMETHRICVCVRKRPLNRQEVIRKDIDVVSIPGRGSLLVHEPKQKVDLTKYLENQVFQFDYSFDETATNELVYKFTAKPLVHAAFEGSMATCFAYGQTGSGKTHTMGGDFRGKLQNSTNGIYFLAAQEVFSLLNHRKYSKLNVSPYVSFFEIYNGKVFDLLNEKAKLRVLEDDKQQVQVVGLEEVFVTKTDDVIKLIEMGSACRTSGQTSANANSSRSHAILQVTLRHNDRAASLYSKFSLVDLAGNERGTDVNSNDRSTLVETAEINCSLLALKECIRSLGKNSDHIPFRMSTLTKVLRDSFIGEKSKTCMIAMVSPSMTSCDYTLNTLRYADRVKELNGPSKANAAAKARDPINSSSDEDSSAVSSLNEVVSEVTRLKEEFQDELQSVNEFAKEMEQTSYDADTALPILVDCVRKMMDSVLALESAVKQEATTRMTSGGR
ncbi:unnamed protein product [Merluccius merluccius]